MSLLTRGSLIPCSPRLEAILGRVEPRETEELEHTILRFAERPSASFSPVWLDSDEEGTLVEWLRRRIRENAPGWSLQTQINLASISAGFDPSGSERGDILLSHPRAAPLLVEVDGRHHAQHSSRDKRRDKQAGAGGLRVCRIPAHEVRAGHGPHLKEILEHLQGAALTPGQEDFSVGVLRLCRFYHQVQTSLVAAMLSGLLDPAGDWTVGIFPPEDLVEEELLEPVLSLAIEELQEILRRLAGLHGLEVTTGRFEWTRLDSLRGAQGCAVSIVPSSEAAQGDGELAGPVLWISDAHVPVHAAAPLVPSEPVAASEPRRADAEWFLRYLFRKEAFLEGQWETVRRALQGKDAIVLLPTGAGKSIAYQLAALLRPGCCLVVDPIISLIEDQIDNLGAYGITNCIGFQSGQGYWEREQLLNSFTQGHHLFAFVAPERMQIQTFRDALSSLVCSIPISLVAVDEAHCVSEWGHDFRTAYLNLGRIARTACAKDGVPPPVLALTGTASRIVLKDVQRELEIQEYEALITPESFDRKELSFRVVSCRSDEKRQKLKGVLLSLPSRFGVTPGAFFSPEGGDTHAGLVFCPHVGGGYGVVQTARWIQEELKIPVRFYSGTPPKGQPPELWIQEKRRIAWEFKRNRVPILVCTKAFGMGIDKPNIRFTVHLGLPPSIESFYQEAGRAGRDRREAECILLSSDDDQGRSSRLLSASVSVEEVEKAVDQTAWGESDDIIRALWFHVRTFRGRHAESRDLASAIRALGDLDRRRGEELSWDFVEPGQVTDGQRNRAEKALHRLVILGIVEDYTVNHAGKTFSVLLSGAGPDEIADHFRAYVASYQHRLGAQALRHAQDLWKGDLVEYACAVGSLLIDFLYEHVELARRRSLAEMLQAARVGTDGEALRKRILDYLQKTDWDDRLESLYGSDEGGLDRLEALFDEVVLLSDAQGLRAAAGRALAAYPDVPGLLLSRAVAEALCPDGKAENMRSDTEAAMKFGLQTYSLDAEVLGVGLGAAVSRASEKPESARIMMDAILGAEGVSRELLREIVQRTSPEFACLAAMRLAAMLAVESRRVLGAIT